MTRTSLLAVCSLTLLTAVVACDDDGGKTPPASEVRERIGSDLKDILDQATAASDGSVMKLSLPGFLGSFGITSTDTTSSGGSALAPDDEESSDDFDPQQIIDELEQQVFTDANEVEPGIYMVPASVACGEPDPEYPEDNADCTENWAQVGLRIRVSENDSSALRFAVQIGAQHDEPLSLSLTHTALSVSVDLDEAEDAIQTVAAALGEQAPHAELSGALTASLEVLGTAHVAFDLNADRAISVAVADQGVDLTGPDAFRFATEASHALHLELDGNAATGNLALDIGATTAQVPDGGDSETGTQTFGIDLPGVAANATLSQGALSITNISLGNSTTRVLQNGATAIAIDLNKDNGRKLDATLTDDGAGGATVSVQPAFDLRIATDHAALGDEVDVYDITRVLLTGALHGTEDSDSVQVASGAFSIETNPTSYGFSASAGQCVTGEDIYDDATFTSYTQWTVGACN
ncbi:MAG TPA: hypothetical protein VGM39_07020 [Kofleriaceae bacterium]|jgi:hypothetical protein